MDVLKKGPGADYAGGVTAADIREDEQCCTNPKAVTVPPRLRDRLDKERAVSMRHGLDANDRAARLTAVLRRLTPEIEETLAVVGELLALGISPFDVPRR